MRSKPKFLHCVFQSDREKEQGLPVAPFMDREKVTKPTAQIGFIKFVLLPMFETIAKVSAKNILISTVAQLKCLRLERLILIISVISSTGERYGYSSERCT
jgi:hypothetical protein